VKEAEMADKKRGAKGQDKFSVKYLDLLLEHGLKVEDLPEDLKGKPVHIPQVNFHVPLEKQVQAKYGPPPYAVRGKQIEDLTEHLLDELRQQWVKVADNCRNHPQQFARIWRAVLDTLELDELNQLIREHNTYYPIEANLQPDPETGRYMIGNTVWAPKKKITPESLAELYPADLKAALAAAKKK
jgi:hypothetical protein